MLAVVFCLAAFVFSYLAGRRSLVASLCVLMTVGYAYGIVRANVPETFSHFIFDAAVVGLYATQLVRRPNAEERRRQRALSAWVTFLIVWPLLLFFVPVQTYEVQLVGLRGNIFMLPLIMLGARLKDEEVYKLALWLAVLNLLAFAVAGAEYFFGLERFFPHNQVTDIIYRGAVDEDYANPDRSTALRIPSTFTSAHAYAGMMVMTLVFLIGAWARRQEFGRWQGRLLNASMVASILGVFMAAARSPVIILGVILLTVFLTGRLKVHGWVSLVLILAGVGWAISSEARLQRFTTLSDVDYLGQRVSWSVNESFLDLAAEYPLGNGLGGGGTSMPYFLQSEVVAPTSYMENEYARIMLEQGLLGLCLWAAFIVWLFTRRLAHGSDPWYLGKRLAWATCLAFFCTGMIGKGLFTSIPGTALMLLSVGWIAVRRARPEFAEEYAPAPAPTTAGKTAERVPLGSGV